jgi:hypothetical protein
MAFFHAFSGIGQGLALFVCPSSAFIQSQFSHFRLISQQVNFGSWSDYRQQGLLRLLASWMTRN